MRVRGAEKAGELGSREGGAEVLGLVHFASPLSPLSVSWTHPPP